jgi:hypothetical protein
MFAVMPSAGAVRWQAASEVERFAMSDQAYFISGCGGSGWIQWHSILDSILDPLDRIHTGLEGKTKRTAAWTENGMNKAVPRVKSRVTFAAFQNKLMVGREILERSGSLS